MTPEQQQHMWDVIRQDAWVTGLYKTISSPIEAKEIGCQVGDVIGCAVYSLAIDLGALPPQPGEYTPDYYEVVRMGYDLNEDQVHALWGVNDLFTDHSQRLKALHSVIFNDLDSIQNDDDYYEVIHRYMDASGYEVPVEPTPQTLQP